MIITRDFVNSSSILLILHTFYSKSMDIIPSYKNMYKPSRSKPTFNSRGLYLYRLFPLFTGSFFVALSLVAVFSVFFWCASKASAPYWNSGSATFASSKGFTASTLPAFPRSCPALSVWYCFTSAASRSVFSMAASAQFNIPDRSFLFA